MMQTGEGDNVEQVSKAKSVELFNLKKTTEGITETIKDFVPDIEVGIHKVDSAMQSIVNQMGQGQGIAQGIKEEYAQAALEVIKLGGTEEKALLIQTKTLEVLGRNVVLSSEQTKNLFAAQEVSGVQIDVLEKAFISAGKSIKDISKEMLQVREVANNMGVNAKAVSALVVQNLDKLNRYGFQNGVEGLAKMAASSQALGIDMTETLDLADDLMSPERSMEVAAMFQRMGASSAALTNPLKLMDLSMNDTAKLQEELGDYFKSFAKFNEKTGQFEIAKSERLKIKQLAQELGISREQIEKMALAGADLDKKLSKISFAGFNIDEETQQMVANMAVMGDKGEYVIKTKDESGKLIEQSIQDFLSSKKGDKDAIKEALGAEKTSGVEGKTPEEINAEMAVLADKQLSTLTRIDKGIEALEKSPGFTAGASKLGEDILKANEVLAKAINESFGKQFASKTEKGEDTEYKKSLDTFGSELEEALKKAKEPGANLQKIAGELMGAGVDFSKNLGNVVAKGGAKALGEIGDVTGAEQILKDAGLEEKLEKGIDKIKEKIKPKEGEFNIGEDGVFNINEQNVEKLNIGGEFNIGKSLDIDQIDAKNVVLGEGVESIVSGQVEEIKKIGDGVTETNKQLIEAQGKLSTDIKEQSESVEGQEIKVITEPEVTQPTIVNPEVTPVIEQNITPEKGINIPETEGGELNIGEGGPTGFVPQVGPALVQSFGFEGLNIEDFIPLNEFISSNLETTKTEEPKTISTPPVTTPTPLINTKTIDEIVLSNTNSSEILKSFEKSSKEIGELKIGEEPKKVELAGPKQEKGFTGFEPKILSTISEKDKTILSKLSQEIVEKPETTIEGINTSNQTLSTNFKSEIEKIKDLKITSNTKEITNLGNYIKDISSEVKSSQEKTQESQSIFLDSANNVFENQSESTKSFIENNTKELPTTPKTNEGEDVMSKYSVIDKDGNKTISPMGRRVMKQLSEKEKEYEGEKGGFLDKILPKEQTIEDVKDLKITSDSTETIKLGKNVENIFTKFENQSDSVKSILEKNSKSTDIFTELSNTNKTILEKTKDEGTNVKTSILNETTDTFINKINEGVEIANKTEEKKNQLSEIQNTITDKDFEKRVAISESLIRDLDITKEQLKISTENALLVEKEKENVETISNFKESDFDKRVEESESLISALDKEIEKQKNVESTVDSTKTLTEQMSNLYKEENFLTVTKPIDTVENETETNVINASPIQPTIAPIELANKNVKPEELSTKVQDFLANQPKQVVETGTNEPIKIETKLTIDGDPRFASLLDARKLQETVEGVMTKSINKPQFAQKISTGTQRANMGMT
jgi:plasmid maintenance system antidote protein VapI